MDRRSFFSALAASLAAVTLLATPAAAQLFSRKEIERRFRLFDTDGDGLINPTEYELNKVYVLFEQRGRTASGAIDRQILITLQNSRLSQAAFNELDINGDGVLTAGEIISSKMMQFESIDLNGDGFIDRDEFEALVRRLFQ